MKGVTPGPQGRKPSRTSETGFFSCILLGLLATTLTTTLTLTLVPTLRLVTSECFLSSLLPLLHLHSKSSYKKNKNEKRCNK